MGNEFWYRWFREVGLQLVQHLTILNVFAGRKWLCEYSVILTLRRPDLNDCSEVILCDFMAGTSVVSFLNIVSVPGELKDICKSFGTGFPGD